MNGATEILHSSNNVMAELNLSSECSSMGEFDKQTLRELHRSDGESIFQNLGRSPGRGGEGAKISPSLEELGLEAKKSRSRPISNRLTLKSVPWSNQSTALQSKANSKQEFGSGKLPCAPGAAHTESSGSKKGLARHRNSIGLLTDNHKADVRSFSQFTSKDTPCQTSSASKESYLLSRDLVGATGHKPSGLSSRRGSKLAFFSLKSVKEISDPTVSKQDECPKAFALSSSLEIVIEPMGEGSHLHPFSNHQVPLISRIPSRLMKRPLNSRSLFVAKKPSFVQLENPPLAHSPGDVCGNSSLIPESTLDHQIGTKPEGQSIENPKFGSRLLPSKTLSSAGENMLLNNSRRFLDESSVRLQSMRGSTHSLQKRKNQYLLAPAPSLRRLSPDRWRAANTNNFPSFKLRLDQSGLQEESSRMIPRSNLSHGQPPVFEISRMQLFIPGSIRSPSLKLASTGTPKLTSNDDFSQKKPIDSRTSDAHKVTGPALDTVPDLEAMINECDVLQRQLITKTTRNQHSLASDRC